MTFWDDPQMVINHIRHSCVTSDDTGMCEMVIVNEEPEIIEHKQRRRLGGYYVEDGPEYGDYSQSFDIAVSPCLTGRTPKATGRHDRLKHEKNEAKQCQKVQWKEPEQLNNDKLAELFPRLSLKKTSSSSGGSLLSSLIKDTSLKPRNPFLEYSQFDGQGQTKSVPTKSLNIFLSFLPGEEKLLSCPITVLSSASVQDVIGLALYKHSDQNSSLRLEPDVSNYSLYIAEEDGEVDLDFHALEENEAISKFGFSHLAVVEKYTPSSSSSIAVTQDEELLEKQSDTLVVTVYIPHNGFSRVKVEKNDIKMKHILMKLVKKRGLKRAGREYILEKQSSPGKPVDLEATLESMGTYEFCLLRAGRRRSEERENPPSETSSVQAEFMSFQYKSYRVMLLQRLLATTEIQLGVHGKKIEIDPVAQAKPAKFWWKIKPISLDMDCIADSEVTDEKPGRSSFRIYYRKGDEFKHFDFEARPHVADEIVTKINNILNTRVPQARLDFMSMKGKKAEKTSKRH